MSNPEAHLLSPYRPPTSYPVTLNPDEAGAWLCGYFALWHPAVLAKLHRPPVASSSYDHDQPNEGFFYAVPEGPHLYQPESWSERVTEAKAIAFTATPDRGTTLANLRTAFTNVGQTSPLLDLAPDVVRQFAAIGYGYLLVESLFDASDHEHLLDAEGFWADVQNAVQAAHSPDASADVLKHLRDAADKLRSARETLNTNPFALLDWAILDGEKLDSPWPRTLSRGLPVTVLASGELLERQATEHPDRFAELKVKFQPNLPSSIDLACGSYAEREDALLPPESQWWNLTKARATVRHLFGVETELYARKRSAYHTQLPAWMTHCGYRKALLVSLDGALTPSRNSAIINWPSPDGKSIDAIGREPQPASDPLTFFNLVYTLQQAMTQDSSPIIPFAHKGTPAAVGYDELVTLTELSSAVGEFTTATQFLSDHPYGEYLGTATADDFFNDSLDERVTTLHRPDAVSGFAKHLRLRRRLDSAFALAALHRSLTPPTPDDHVEVMKLNSLEDAIETRGANDPVDFDSLGTLESTFAQKLADRLQSSAAPNTPGMLVFNPCAFTRRVALEIDNFGGAIPAVDPVKAAQFDGNAAKLVVEVPALGFAWIPRPTGNTPAPKPRLKTAEGTLVRNEFFEAELDPNNGGLRAFRDTRTRLNRLGMQLVFNPGSKSRVRSINVTSAGTALGEVVAEGDILNEHDAVLATFRHRIRAWVGRPALEVQLDIVPQHQPTGYPWHAYYGARFGWRDERAALFRGVNGLNAKTTYTRPVSPDYLEIRLAAERTFIFTGGLPFIQRHGTRMADVVLIPEGEHATRFEFLLAMDRDYPMQTATGWVAPSPVVRTDRGPPNGMTSSWLAHLDMPSVLLTSLRPTPEGRGVTAQFLETANFGGTTDFRLAIPPARATVVNGEGHEAQDITLIESTIPLEFSASEAFRVKVTWA